jgi:hypothetical protein
MQSFSFYMYLQVWLLCQRRLLEKRRGHFLTRDEYMALRDLEHFARSMFSVPVAAAGTVVTDAVGTCYSNWRFRDSQRPVMEIVRLCWIGSHGHPTFDGPQVLGQLFAIKYLWCYEMSQAAFDMGVYLSWLKQRKSDARFWERTQIKEFWEQSAEENIWT